MILGYDVNCQKQSGQYIIVLTNNFYSLTVAFALKQNLISLKLYVDTLSSIAQDEGIVIGSLLQTIICKRLIIEPCPKSKEVNLCLDLSGNKSMPNLSQEVRICLDLSQGVNLYQVSVRK